MPRNLRWEVSCDGVTRRMIDWLFSKERAIDHAFERAEEIARWEPHARFDIVVLRPDGSEDERHTVSAVNIPTLRAS